MLKTQQQILDSILNRLIQNTDIQDVDPGMLARTFAEVISEQIHEFYTELELSSLMPYVSTAQGQFLDLIGQLLNCERLAAENDENYRARIINQVYVVAGANETAIRLKALQVSGVKDIVMREFTRGAGSFSVYVITDDPNPSDELIQQVEDAVNAAKASGVSAEVRKPVLILVDLKVRVIFNDTISEAEKTTLRQRANELVRSYLNKEALGDTVDFNTLMNSILALDDKIVDVDFYDMKVNASPRNVHNIKARWNERIIANQVEVV